MHIAEDCREREILKLPIRRQLQQLLLGELDVGPFREYFRRPSYFYAQGWPNAPANWPTFSDRQLLPLWEHGPKIVALDLAAKPQHCLWFYAESPDEYTNVASLDAAVFAMIELHVWEYGGDETEAAEAADFARLIDLPNRGCLAVLLSDPLNTTDESIQRYRESLS